MNSRRSLACALRTRQVATLTSVVLQAEHTLLRTTLKVGFRTQKKGRKKLRSHKDVFVVKHQCRVVTTSKSWDHPASSRTRFDRYLSATRHQPDAVLRLVSSLRRANVSDFATIIHSLRSFRRCDLIRDPRTGHALGYGFVGYDRFDAAETALEEMDGYMIGQSQIRVAWARESRPKGTSRSLQNDVQ